MQALRTEAPSSLHSTLSSREIEVLRLAAAGCADKEIALHLGVSLTTVRTYWDRIRGKIRAKNRTHAVCIALCTGDLGLKLTDILRS